MIVVWHFPIFQRRMVQSLLSVTIATSLILSLLVWLVQSLRYCSMMAYTSLTLGDVGWLAFYLWPKTIVVCVSLSYIYGIVWVFGRWKRYHMLTAMQSAGASHGFVWWPAWLVGGVLSLALGVLAKYGGPRAAQVSHQYARVLDKSFNPAFMIPKIFFSMGGKTLYSGEQLSNQEWRNVLIHDISHPPQERLLHAKRVVLQPHKQGLWLDVHHGTLVTVGKDHTRAPHCVYWKRYQGWYKGDVETAKSLANLLPHRWAETLDSEGLRAWHTAAMSPSSLSSALCAKAGLGDQTLALGHGSCKLTATALATDSIDHTHTHRVSSAPVSVTPNSAKDVSVRGVWAEANVNPPKGQGTGMPATGTRPSIEWQTTHSTDKTSNAKSHQSMVQGATQSIAVTRSNRRHDPNWAPAVVRKALIKEQQYRIFWPLWPVLNAMWLPLWWIVDYGWRARMLRGGALFGLYAGMMTGWAGWSVMAGVVVFALMEGRWWWPWPLGGQKGAPVR